LTIQHGDLAARSGGRLSIDRSVFVGVTATPGAAPAQPGFAEDFAYQAMENLAVESLQATVDSQDHRRLGILFHIKGRHDPPTRVRAVIGLADLARGQGFAKPIPLPSGTNIDLTLDTSLNFGELVDALMAAWTGALKPGTEAHAAGAATESPPPAPTHRLGETP
jgi:hypothetical protein